MEGRGYSDAYGWWTLYASQSEIDDVFKRRGGRSTTESVKRLQTLQSKGLGYEQVISLSDGRK